MNWQTDGGAAWFGNAATATYASLAPPRRVSGALVSPPVALPWIDASDAARTHLQLELALALATEWDAAATYDNPLGLDRVTLWVRDGAFATPVWTSDLIGGSTHGADTVAVADLATWRGRTVRFAVAFDSGDDHANDHAGLHVRSAWAGTRCR